MFPASALDSRSRRSRSRASFSADRSTARRATRRRRRRDFSPGSTRRSRCAANEPFVLERSEAYAAVMVDDLTQKGVEEPYRLFTSRAEYRLLLGVDTVLPRLLPHGRRLGLIDRAEFDDAMRGEERLRRGEETLRRRVFNPSVETRELLREKLGIELDAPVSAFKLLQRNDLSIAALEAVAPEAFDGLSAEQVSYPREPSAVRGLHPARAGAARAAEAVRVASDPARRLPTRRSPVFRGKSSRSARDEDPGRSATPRGFPGVTPAAVAIISAHVVRAGERARALP